MQFIKPDVQTICFGMAMSMGSLLLTGGANGKRLALPNSRMLIHQPSAGFEGQSTDIEIHAREILDMRGRIDKIYALPHGPAASSRSTRTWSATASSRPTEAVEYGLIDRVIDRALSASAAAIGCSIAPRPSISIRTTSPSLQEAWRVERHGPRRSGVPVRMRSPGSSVRVSRDEVDEVGDAEDEVGRCSSPGAARR